MATNGKPRLAVYKLSSCAGCQLQILNLEDVLLDIAGAVEIAHFPMASRQMLSGPYDIGFVEGAVTEPEEINKVKEARRDCRVLVALGSCAAFGGLPSLKNRWPQWEVERRVYPRPELIHSVAARPVGEYVRVDAILRGCPIDPDEFLELVKAVLIGVRPRLNAHSLCLECRLQEVGCLFDKSGSGCMGPITAGGCGALCPGLGRACEGCRGPAEGANLAGFARLLAAKGYPRQRIVDHFQKYAGAEPAMVATATALAWEEAQG